MRNCAYSDWHLIGGGAGAANEEPEGATLSYVGQPFDYDVFVSYAHAEAETKAPLIRDWSRGVAYALTTLTLEILGVRTRALDALRASSLPLSLMGRLNVRRS